MRTSSDSGIVILDTHVWLWLINGDDRLGKSKVLESISHAAVSSNLRVSAISIWEIGMLEFKGRITLPMDCLQWVKEALEAPGIQLMPILPPIAISSSRLPGKFHGDPADRLVVATARYLNGTIATADRKILEYGRQNCVNVVGV